MLATEALADSQVLIDGLADCDWVQAALALHPCGHQVNVLCSNEIERMGRHPDPGDRVGSLAMAFPAPCKAAKRRRHYSSQKIPSMPASVPFAIRI